MCIKINNKKKRHKSPKFSREKYIKKVKKYLYNESIFILFCIIFLILVLIVFKFVINIDVQNLANKNTEKTEKTIETAQIQNEQYNKNDKNDINCENNNENVTAEIDEKNNNKNDENNKNEVNTERIDNENNLSTKKEINSNLSDWELILVNKKNKIPENYETELTKINYSHYVDSRIAESLEKMLSDAESLNLNPIICSSFRTKEKQEYLFYNKVDEYIKMGNSYETAYDLASYWVAIPGTGEHQTGLAVDIVSEDYQILDKKQEETRTSAMAYGKFL